MKFEYHQGPSFKADKMKASHTNYELDNGRGAAPRVGAVWNIEV